MNLDPRAREYYALEIVTTPSVESWSASFDQGATWVDGATTGTVSRWLVAGPDADPEGAVAVIPTSGKPLIRATSNPEIVVRHAPGIYVQ